MSHADTFIQLMARFEHRKQMPLKCKCSFVIITYDIVRFVFGHIMNQEGTHELNLVGLAKLFLIMIFVPTALRSLSKIIWLYPPD